MDCRAAEIEGDEERVLRATDRKNLVWSGHGTLYEDLNIIND
jgi:hypothetical protein